jgi:hypothetical protein
MDALLGHPAVQAVVLPFLVALAAAAALRKTRHLGLAITAGFLCAAAFTVGFQFEPLTAVKKVVLVGIAAGALGAILQSRHAHVQRMDRMIIAIGVALAVLWVLQRILVQQPPATAALAGASAIAYIVALLAGAGRASDDPVAAAASTLVTGFATGALALFGASALLMQLGIGIGAGAGAVLALLFVSGARAPGGWTLAFSAQLTAALVAVLAVASGSLPWYCLLPMPLAPWLAHFGSRAGKPAWQRAVLCSIFALVPAAIAVVLAGFTAGRAAG